MKRAITRRDFLEGASVAIAGSMVPGELLAATVSRTSKAPNATNVYPPAQVGLRGSHQGSFEVAHQLALEGRSDWGPVSDSDGIVYDLVVVGAGISGLSAAHFYQKQHPDATILILDNHDDFGGHAKRNEFVSGGQRILGYGGSQSLENPGRYSEVTKGLLKDIRVDVDRFRTAYDQDFNKRWDLGPGIYFDHGHYGVDRVVRGELYSYETYLPAAPTQVAIIDSIPQMPISDEAKRQLIRLYTESKDQLPDHSILGEGPYLESISYREFLIQHMGVTDPQALELLHNVLGDMGGGLDLMPALWGMVIGLPGFDATDMGLFEGVIKHFWKILDEPYIAHFPDGNASIARLLVRMLIPGVAPGHTMEDVVGAAFDYSRLDRSDAAVRLRLSSTVVKVSNLGSAKTASEVAVTYMRGGQAYRTRARNCVLACYNRIIPHLCPELPAKQKNALALLVKTPLVYTNVLLRNWQPWKKLGIHTVHCPGTYHRLAMLDFPVSLGSVKFSASPDEPIVVHMNRVPNKPGLTERDQNRAGRGEMLTTSFESIERDIRTHLAGMLGSEGFDPAHDIEAITVNRWPHGYSWWNNPLMEPHFKEDEIPFIVGRQRFGRIAIANADAGGQAYVDGAIDQAHRAVEDLEN